MSFFDNKEEVLNIELTQYGKYLLSKGKFDPKYYAFYDDDIIYDANYAGVEEHQSYTQDRILDESLSVKPQVIFTSVENSLFQKEEYVVPDISAEEAIYREKLFASKPELEKNILFSLGNSSLNTEYMPAWHINMLNGSIASAQPNLLQNSNGNEEYINIPQIYLNTGSLLLKTISSEENVPKGWLKKEDFIEGEQPLSLIMNMESTNFLLEIIEKNVDFNKENFEIEIFVEEDKSWKKLSFKKQKTNIRNNILLDDYIYQENDSKTPDESDSEYYFDVYVDEEIEVPGKIRDGSAKYTTSKNGPFGDNC